MKIYCPDCGQATEYASAKPNFCMQCGFNFKTMRASLNKNKHIKQETDDDPEVIGEDDVRELDPRIHSMSGLDVEINHDHNPSVTFGQLFPPSDSSQAPSKSNSDAG